MVRIPGGLGARALGLVAAEAETRPLDLLPAHAIDVLRDSNKSMFAAHLEEEHERERIRPHRVRPVPDRPFEPWEIPVVEVPTRRRWGVAQISRGGHCVVGISNRDTATSIRIKTILEWTPRYCLAGSYPWDAQPFGGWGSLLYELRSPIVPSTFLTMCSTSIF